MSMINRRGFLFGSAAVAALSGCATKKVGLRKLNPGEKRTLAVIGCGGMSHALVSQFLNKNLAPNVKIVAACDCNRKFAKIMADRVDRSYGEKGGCRISYDFREIVADPAIDIVCIATPDHWHAYISVEAMKHGKDVYCEKPLTYTVKEAAKVIKAQEMYGRVLQTGSWQRSAREFRDAVSLIRGGLIGDVKYVDANFGADGKYGGPSHPMRFWHDPANADAESKPNSEIDWKMWLGPAQYRPYSSELANRDRPGTPMFWRCDDDLASGMIGDWGAHHLDIVQWALNLDNSGPSKVVASSQPYSTNLYHGGRRQWGAKMHFETPSGRVELYHGPFSYLPEKAQNKSIPVFYDSVHGWGSVYYGTKGIVAVRRGGISVWLDTDVVKPNDEIRAKLEKCEFMPEKIVASSHIKGAPRLSEVLDKIEQTYADVIKKAGIRFSSNHVKDFCECVESRRLPITHAGVGGRASVLCQLLNLSYKYDVGFDWDPVKMDFANGTGCGISLDRIGDCNGWKVSVC